MLILALLPATLLAAVWLILLSRATREDWIAAAYNKVLDNLHAIEKLRLKDAAKQERMANYHDVAALVMKRLLGGTSDKEIAKLQLQNEQLQSGNLKQLPVFALPGYVFLRSCESVRNSRVHKAVFTKNAELYGKKYAANKTQQLLAKQLSYAMLGVSLSLSLGALFTGIGSTSAGISILVVGTVLVLVLVYAMYDELNDQANKRRKDISRQFPNVVSKLALLVTSGMIVDRAWRETAYSQELTLYKEMQKTAQELSNLVSPEVAYENFIIRCNTKETAKLASAMIQNQSKGNAEIGLLLKDMAHDAWLERRHMAKRDSEHANSKLMIPTMLLFLAILAMLMVPIAMSFSAL